MAQEYKVKNLRIGIKPYVLRFFVKAALTELVKGRRWHNNWKGGGGEEKKIRLRHY